MRFRQKGTLKHGIRMTVMAQRNQWRIQRGAKTGLWSPTFGFVRFGRNLNQSMPKNVLLFCEKIKIRRVLRAFLF